MSKSPDDSRVARESTAGDGARIEADTVEGHYVAAVQNFYYEYSDKLRKQSSSVSARIGSATAGILVALLIVYWLHPLNAGAVGLVVVFCVGLSEIIWGGVRAVLTKRSEEQ